MPDTILNIEICLGATLLSLQMRKTWRMQIINFPTNYKFSWFNYSKTWAQELGRSGGLNQRKELSEHIMAFMVQNTELRLPSEKIPETANILKCTSPRLATDRLSLFPWLIKPRHSQLPHVSWITLEHYPLNVWLWLNREALSMTRYLHVWIYLFGTNQSTYY